MVRYPEEYKWSGHNAYLGLKPIVWLETDYVLRSFSEDRESAMRYYNQFVHKGIACEPEVDFKNGMRSGIIGDDDYIKRILMKSTGEVKRQDLSIEEAIEKTCIKYGISKEELSSSNRGHNLCHVRAVLAFIARETNILSIFELSKVLKRDPSGLSRLATKLDAKLRASPLLHQEIMAFKNELCLEKYNANS